MTELFEIGTPVWCKMFGGGKVKDIDHSSRLNDTYAVTVVFDGGSQRHFSLTGRWSADSGPILTPIDFAAGDTVMFAGVKHKLTKNDDWDAPDYSLSLCAPYGVRHTFTRDGKLYSDATEPALFMIKRHEEPKRPEPKFKPGDQVLAQTDRMDEPIKIEIAHDANWEDNDYMYTTNAGWWNERYLKPAPREPRVITIRESNGNITEYVERIY